MSLQELHFDTHTHAYFSEGEPFRRVQEPPVVLNKNIVLNTRDVFYCEQYKLREITSRTVVDAARDAARSLRPNRNPTGS